MNLCPSLIVHLDKEECKSATEPDIHGKEVESRPLGSIPLSGRDTFNCQACNNDDVILDTRIIISPIGLISALTLLLIKFKFFFLQM